MDTVNRMVSFLKARADERESSELPVIPQSAENLVYCLGNVMKAGALIATVGAATVLDVQKQVSEY